MLARALGYLGQVGAASNVISSSHGVAWVWFLSDLFLLSELTHHATNLLTAIMKSSRLELTALKISWPFRFIFSQTLGMDPEKFVVGQSRFRTPSNASHATNGNLYYSFEVLHP